MTIFMSPSPVVSTPIVRIFFFKSTKSDHIPIEQDLAKIVQIRLIWRDNKPIERLIIAGVISALAAIEMMTMTCAVK